ncbi:GAF domain-containing protein [Duganella sp. FT92W]|uniref:GAF domain-containing protein n=1 Tax=Pseudoduganella rivuli TaxID=2666085 RepID=A0A7X2IIU5_9BURK|nr:GAF domain-containing protein [Pseudoduganella rivuli]
MESFATRPRQGWAAALAIALAVAVAAALGSHAARERERQSQLQTALQRHAIEAMSLTLDGNLMGAIAVLGLVQPAIKRESTADIPPNSPEVQALLGSVAHAYQAQGLFVVGIDGIVKSSWDDSGKPSTGLQVKFRPYFQAAMLGRENVYAAISLSRDEHALYFAAPIYPDMLRGGNPVGAVVARTGMDQLNRLLASTGKTALLLSPQGVVFGSNRKEWQGRLAGPVTPQRTDDIRALRQFGKLFEERQPVSLPFDVHAHVATVDGRRHIVASAPVNWNDPAGGWQLVLLEDLSRTIAPGPIVRDALAAGAGALLLALMVLRMLRSRAALRLSSAQLEQLAHEQAARAERKMEQAHVALRLQQAESREEGITVFLAECHRMFGALQGAVYGAEDDRLRLLGSYAAGAAPASVAIGEGLLGQCARDRQPRVIDMATQGGSPWRIRSGLGDTEPAAVLLAPVLLQARLLGVVELALPAPPGAAALKQFAAVADLLAVHLQFARRTARTADAVPQ